MEDNKAIEQNEIEVILQNGFSFDIPRKSIFSVFSKSKTRKINIKPFSIGIEAMMCKKWLDLKYSESGDNKFTALIVDNYELHCEALAIAYLGSKFKVRLFKWFVKKYFENRINPKILLGCYTYLMAMCDIKNFTIATILVTDSTLMSPKKGNFVA